MLIEIGPTLAGIIIIALIAVPLGQYWQHSRMLLLSERIRRGFKKL